MVAVYHVAPDTLVLVTYTDTTICVALWSIEHEQCIRAFGRIYARETDAAARFVVECARYCGQEVAFQAQAGA